MEHLLICAQIFPMTVKLLLAKDGLYAPSRAEVAEFAVVDEYLLAENPFLAGFENPNHGDFPWAKVREKRASILLREHVRQIFKDAGGTPEQG